MLQCTSPSLFSINKYCKLIYLTVVDLYTYFMFVRNQIIRDELQSYKLFKVFQQS
jgi:hypothetical protein